MRSWKLAIESENDLVKVTYSLYNLSEVYLGVCQSAIWEWHQNVNHPTWPGIDLIGKVPYFDQYTRETIVTSYLSYSFNNGINTCKVGSYPTTLTERTIVKNNLRCCNHHELSQIRGETYCICVNFTAHNVWTFYGTILRKSKAEIADCNNFCRLWSECRTFLSRQTAVKFWQFLAIKKPSRLIITQI